MKREEKGDNSDKELKIKKKCKEEKREKKKYHANIQVQKYYNKSHANK